jgi:hypothetical protein
MIHRGWWVSAFTRTSIRENGYSTDEGASPRANFAACVGFPYLTDPPPPFGLEVAPLRDRISPRTPTIGEFAFHRPRSKEREHGREEACGVE